MELAAIWRYPVKSMAGERLTQAALDALGIAGDRLLGVASASGRILTARTHPRLLGHRATLDPVGEVLVDGRPWEDPSVARDVEEIGGPGARLRLFAGDDRFDVLPLLVATDGAIAAFGHDGRRLRPNLIIGGVPGMSERDWPGAELRIGAVRIGIQDRRARCIMTSFDPDTLAQDREVTRSIYERFENQLALNAFVITGGRIAVGDAVELLPPDTESRPR